MTVAKFWSPRHQERGADEIIFVNVAKDGIEIGAQLHEFGRVVFLEAREQLGE